MTRTALYRHYDASGALLYVGISLSAIERLGQHSASPWFDQIETVRIQYFASRGEAVDAEREAIRRERPLFNVRHVAKNPVAEVIDAIGQDRLMSALRLKKSAIGNARARGVVPARWFIVVEKLCGEAGIACPSHAFKWKRARPTAAPASERVG